MTLGDGLPTTAEQKAELARRIAERYGREPAAPTPEPAALLDDLLGQALSAADGQQMLDSPAPIEYIESTRLGEDAFYRYGFHFVCGHKKSGKSWLTTMQGLDHAEDGHPWVVFDFENGKARFTRRLAELGIRNWPANLIYLPHPTLPPTVDGWQALVAELGRRLPGAFVAVDSYRSLTGHYGFEVTDPNGVEKLCQPFVRAESLTVATLDHSKMSATAKSKDVAAWNAAKQQIADAVYFVDKTQPYNVTDEGELVLTVIDDRDGRLRSMRTWAIGGQGEDAPLHFEEKERPHNPADDGQVAL